MKYRIQIFLILLSFTHGVDSYAQIFTDTIYSSPSDHDARVHANHTGTNYGSDTLLNVFVQSTKQERTFFRMDLTDIPSNAKVLTADLKLYALVVDNTIDHPMYVRRVLTNWYDSIVTYSAVPTVTSGGQVSIPDDTTDNVGWQTFRINDLAQNSVNYPNQNYGWQILLASESGASTRGVKYASSDHGTTTKRPYIVIRYVLPIDIDANIYHCSSGNDDGKIIPTISAGSETYTSYEWFHYNLGTVSSIQSGTNFSNIDIDSLSDGLYLLRVTDSIGLIGYKYFLVGEYGSSTSVEFRNNSSTTNSALFNEDAKPSLTVSSSDGSSVTGGSNLCYAFRSSSSYQSSLLKYQVEFDPLFSFQQADLSLISQGHYRNASPVTTDSSYISRCLENWGEVYVNWNIKPTVSTTDRIVIDETNPTGAVTRNDTLDLLSYIEFWQEYPDSNFGVDLSLKKYAQSSNAYLRYYSYDDATASNRPCLRLTYSLPEQVTTDFVDSLGTGSISLIAPSGELPYKYLISTLDTLPVLDTIWYAIKDSIAIDSASFYRGQFNSYFHTFENLPADRYFIGVYDNNGDKIFDHQVYVKPSLRLADTNDVVIDGDTIFVDYPSSSSARVVHFDVISMFEDGGMEIEVTQLDDDIIVGFNNMQEPKVVYEGDFEYALKIESSGDVTFLRDGISLSTERAIVGDQLRLIKEANQINFFKNGLLEFSDTIRDSQLDDFKTEIHLKGPAASVMYKPHGKVKPVPQTQVGYAICGENLATLTIYPTIFHGYTINSYSLVNTSNSFEFETDEIYSAPVIIQNIPVGIYNLITSWSNGYSTIHSVVEVVIGYRVHWVEKSNITESAYPLNTISPSSNPGLAKSLNTVNSADDYWIQFQQKFLVGTMSISIFEIKNLNGDIEGGIGILRLPSVTYAAFYSSVGLELLEPGVVYAVSPDMVQLPTEAPLRITHSGGEITVRYLNTDLVVFNSSVSGDVRAEVNISGSVVLINTMASFCYPIASPYVKLRRTIDGGHYLANEGILNVEYDEEYNDDELEFYVYQEAGNDEVGESAWTVSPISYGDNRLSFSFTDTICLANGYYILEIVNKKKEKRYLRFKIVNSTC